jgi:DNA polymerase-3 subunit delta'
MSLQDIVGHARQLSLLREALRHGNLAPAYLFTGPEGVGKRTVALQFARAVLCREMPGDGCGRCRSCLQIERGGHPDFILTAPEKRTLKISQVREMQQFLSLTPAWCDREFSLVDDAESMNIESANAMLKTLEEPPAGTLVVLVSSNPGALLPTVISRCRKVGFGLLSEPEVEQVLLNRGVGAEEAAVAASLAEGCPGSVAAFEGEAWKKSSAGLERVAKAVAAGDKGALLTAVEKGVAGDREGMDLMVRVLLGKVRREIRRRLGLEKAVESARWAVLEEADEAELHRLAARLVEASRLLAGNVNAKLVLGVLFTDWVDEAGRSSA